ncbi:L,D-transpeptidase [Candidatus Fermentibacteria bacterium]|nr:L,D-transpeptidase [Candidatus Fermentibacteria bacterium]
MKGLSLGLLLVSFALGANASENAPVPTVIPDSVLSLPSDSLRAIAGAWRIDIYRDWLRLQLSKGGVPVRDYLCSVGNDSIGKATPTGRFRIIGKIKDPPMYWKNGTRIPPGDWRNSYGPRWMSLGEEPRGTYRRYGIHGTNVEDSVGKFISSGCIRLHNDSVIELFDLVPEGTPVFIH